MTSEEPLKPRIPVSTYRLQFNRYFKFTDARGIIPYLNDLGISDIYASPIIRQERVVSTAMILLTTIP